MSFEALHTIDKCVLLTLNGSNNLFLDNLVVTLTSAYTWILLYGALLYLVIKNNENWWKIILIVGTIGIGLLIVDGVNLGIVKPLIARPRPLNSPELQGIGQSANAFLIAVFFCLLVRDKIFSCFMFLWAIIVSLTRPYLGVHYPSDIFVGAIFGTTIAILIYFLYLRIYIRFSDKLHYISTRYTRTGYSFADIDLVLTVLVLTFIYTVFRALLLI